MTLAAHTPDRIRTTRSAPTRRRFPRRDSWGTTVAAGAVAVESLPALTKGRSRS